MQAIVSSCAAEAWPARVVAVIAHRPGSAGLAFAATHGISTAVVDHQAFVTRDAFDSALAAEIDVYQPDLVVLAGFMRMLGADFVRRYEGRMLNVHPSLLPAFRGLHTHRRAIAAGCKVAGVTVHFVAAELDHGPIVAQAVVPVLPADAEAVTRARDDASHSRPARGLRLPMSTCASHPGPRAPKRGLAPRRGRDHAMAWWRLRGQGKPSGRTRRWKWTVPQMGLEPLPPK